VPSLGVKADCIPGYSSHRSMRFSWRGAYWGQCMEVCGRYHHWMPITVRVCHSDAFVRWFTAFVSGAADASDSAAN